MDLCGIEENLQEKVKQQDNIPARVIVKNELEKKHTQSREVAEKVREDYYEAYLQMTKELSSSHLDGFAELIMNQDELINAIKEQLMKYLQNSLDRFWNEYEITHRLAELEMLKEQFKQYKGRTWNVHHMKPVERTLPLRMRFKQARVQYLEKQLIYQNEQLKSLMAVNSRNRSRIRDIEGQRKSTLLTLVRYTNDIITIKPPVKQTTDDLIYNINKDLVLK